jgi:hypothetical protein
MLNLKKKAKQNPTSQDISARPSNAFSDDLSHKLQQAMLAALVVKAVFTQVARFSNPLIAGVFNLSYQVIARKYRPQTFADLTGQEHISRTLSHALDNSVCIHAYLFLRRARHRQDHIARILAKGLNCHTGITSQPCLQCPSCLEIAAGNSLDVLGN